MAHELEIRKGKASMMYVGEVPWHGLGTRLDRPATAAEAIQAANMDWQVVKVPLYAYVGKTAPVPAGKFGVVRNDQIGTDECKVLGVVGAEYEPLQNCDAFTFFDDIVGHNAAIYHTAGVLNDGRRVWILAKLPGEIRVANDDITHKYLLLANSHDGSSAVQVKFTPVRVVCNNTLTYALRQGKTLRVAHCRNVRERLRQAETNLGIIHTAYRDMEQAFHAMCKVQMDTSRLAAYLKGVFPDPLDQESQDAMRLTLGRRQRAAHFFAEGKGNSATGVAGTLWAAYNGVTESMDHVVLRHDPAQHLNSVWFGDRAAVKARAYQLAKKMLSTSMN